MTATTRVRPYIWIIDKVFEDSDKRFVGVTGPSDGDILLLDKGTGRRFRLLTDDRDLIAEGRLFGDEKTADDFAPLDNFGMPNWGCTIISYWKPGEGGGWKDL